MAITLWNILEATILCLNAICVLHEERFLAKIGWSSKTPNYGFSEQPSVKSNLLNLVRSIRTVMRKISLYVRCIRRSLSSFNIFEFIGDYQEIACGLARK